MSAVTVWEGSTAAPTPAAPSGRPRLHLVPTGAAVTERRSQALRLTRRGRLAVTTAVAVVLVVIGVAMAARAVAAPSIAEHAVVVPAGSTLSQVAARELPDVPLAQAVADLQRVNGLSSDQVAAGQTLLVPAH